MGHRRIVVPPSPSWCWGSCSGGSWTRFLLKWTKARSTRLLHAGQDAVGNRPRWIAERILASTPEIEATSRRTGAELGLFATAQNTGDIVARLTPPSRRSRDIFAIIDDVRDQVNAAVPRLHIEFVQILSDVINDLAGAAKPVEIKLFGERLDSLEAYARRLEPGLDSVAGLEDLYNGVSEPSPELLMRVNQAEADRLGLTPEDVGNTVSAALLGTRAGEVRSEDRPVAVRVRAPDSVRFDPLRLRELPIGAGTPLGSLASFTPAESRMNLERENQQQMIAITADVSGRSLGGVMGDVRRVLAEQPPPAGIRVVLGGQESQHGHFRLLPLSCYSRHRECVSRMVVQFESFVGSAGRAVGRARVIRGRLDAAAPGRDPAQRRFRSWG